MASSLQMAGLMRPLETMMNRPALSGFVFLALPMASLHMTPLRLR